MNTEELEAKLEGGEETPSVEFKAAMDWDHRSLTRDILAMANVQDGGVIIVGVADGTFERHGLTEANISTYNIDIMRDQVSPYADPHVDFRVSFPKDSDGKTFAAIEVSPFAEVPVICGRSMQDVKEGDLYYRSSDRRPQSARISNSHDMRDLIERAIVKRRNKLLQIGLVQQEANVADALDAELGGL